MKKGLRLFVRGDLVLLIQLRERRVALMKKGLRLTGKGAAGFASHLPPPPPLMVKTEEEPGSPQYQVDHPTSYLDPVFVEHQQKVAQALTTGEPHFSPEQQAAAAAADYRLPSGRQLSPGMQEAIATHSIKP
jgi:hypothetical protein